MSSGEAVAIRSVAGGVTNAVTVVLTDDSHRQRWARHTTLGRETSPRVVQWLFEGNFEGCVRSAGPGGCSGVSWRLILTDALGGHQRPTRLDTQVLRAPCSPREQMYRETSGSSSRPLMLKLVAILAVAPSSVSLGPARRLGECTGVVRCSFRPSVRRGCRLNLQLWVCHCDHLRNVLKGNCHQIVQSTEDSIV